MGAARDIAILIPAAGASSRMRGRDKLLEEVDGLPLLRRQVLRALETGAQGLVTLPAADHPRAGVLEGVDITQVFVPDAHEGMAASLRRGARALAEDTAAVMVVPSDMPDLEAQDFMLLINVFRANPHPMLQQATGADGTPGHPVLFPADCIGAFRDLQGDQGARPIVQANRHRLNRVALEGNRALTDLDTPEAWAAWRAARGPQGSSGQ